MVRILTVLRSYYHQDIHFLKVHFHLHKSFYPKKTPAYIHFRDLQYR